MKFDWTVNFGHILTLVSLLVVLAAGYMNLVRRIDRIEGNLDLVFGWFKDNIIGGLDDKDKRKPRRTAPRNRWDDETEDTP